MPRAAMGGRLPQMRGGRIRLALRQARAAAVPRMELHCLRPARRPVEAGGGSVSSSYDSAVVDTAMIEDARLLVLPRGVRLLYFEALVWAKLRRTDGLIPRAALPRMTDEPDPADAADRLVQVGLWEAVPGGWQIVNFTSTQMSAVRVEAQQRAAAERYDRWRSEHPDHPRGKRNGVANGKTNANGNGPARPPSRPPARVEGGGGGRDAAGATLEGGPSALPKLIQCPKCQLYFMDRDGHTDEDCPNSGVVAGA